MPQRTSKNQTISRRAGIIVLKEYDDEYLILGLRVYGSYDLPKGGVESFETDLVAAMRETEEEAGITDLDFRWGLQTTTAKNVTLFLAVTTQEPSIKRNPETGEYEHHAAKWLTLDQAEAKLHPYLRPTIEWVRQTTRDY